MAKVFRAKKGGCQGAGLQMMCFARPRIEKIILRDWLFEFANINNPVEQGGIFKVICDRRRMSDGGRSRRQYLFFLIGRAPGIGGFVLFNAFDLSRKVQGWL